MTKIGRYLKGKLLATLFSMLLACFFISDAFAGKITNLRIGQGIGNVRKGNIDHSVKGLRDGIKDGKHHGRDQAYSARNGLKGVVPLKGNGIESIGIIRSHQNH